MRVIAVSAETSLAAALNMMDGWEVVFAHDPDQIPSISKGASVLLAGGGTEEGLALVASLRAGGIELPAIVLGDRPPPDDATSTVLTPPFTLDELRSAVENAVRAAPPPAPAPPVEASSSADQPAQREGVEPAAQAPAPADVVTPDGNGSSRTAMTDLREIAVPEPEPEPEPEPVARAVTPAPARPAPSSPQPAPEEDDADEPAPAAPPPVAVPIPPPPAPVQDRGWRKKKKDKDKAPVVPRDDAPIAVRLRGAEEAARAIESILADMPFLADIELLAGALIGEIVEAFNPEVAVLYLPGTEGSYWVAGGHELTNAERRLKVKADHPLFRELFAAREPMLIAPLDLARALVSGVAGARTEALIASPVYSGSNCVGVIVVGRDDFSDQDLDSLARICAEAAPGLGVAEAIDRLRTFRG